MRRNGRRNRRGATIVQWVVVAALILLVSIAMISSLGTNAKTNLNTTAGNIADPSTLPSRFGS